MRRAQRLIAAAVLIAFAGVLSGCSGFGSNFDPTDLLDWLDTKKKLPGDRKPVFPEGVPGLEQGVPKDLYKGAQQQNDQAAANAAAAQPPAEAPPQKQQAKSNKSKPPADIAAQQAAGEANGEAAVASGDARAAPPPPPKPQQGRAQAHHSAAARSARHAAGPAARTGPACTGAARTGRTRRPANGGAISSPAARRHLYPLILTRHCI